MTIAGKLDYLAAAFRVDRNMVFGAILARH
jgi:hypothetical protein